MQINDFLSAHRRILLFLGVLAVLVYGAELFHFGFTPDEELYGAAPSSVFIGHGRWGWWLLAWILLPFTAIPVVPTLLALAAVVLSAAVLLALLRGAWRQQTSIGPYAAYTAGALFVTSPNIIAFLIYNICNYACGIAMLAGVVAVALAVRPGHARAFLALTLMVAAFSLYQGAALFVLSAFAGWLLFISAAEDSGIAEARRRLLRPILRFGVVFVAAVVLYGVITAAVWALSEVDTGYAAGHMDLSMFFAPWVYSELGRNITAVYAGAAEIYGAPHWSLAVLVAGSLLLTVVGLVRLGGGRVLVALRLGLLLSPFALHIPAGGTHPLRVLVGLPVVLTTVFLLALQLTSFRFLRRLLLLCAVLVVLHNAALINRVVAGNEISLAADRHMAFTIGLEVAQLQQSTDEPPRLLVIGRIDRPSFLVDRFSFFSCCWDNSRRVVAFFKALGIPVAGRATLADLKRLIPKQAEMPVWPRQGSVAVLDDVAVVKLGRLAANQFIDFCADEVERDACVAELSRLVEAER